MCAIVIMWGEWPSGLYSCRPVTEIKLHTIRFTGGPVLSFECSRVNSRSEPSCGLSHCKRHMCFLYSCLTVVEVVFVHHDTYEKGWAEAS